MRVSLLSILSVLILAGCLALEDRTSGGPDTPCGDAMQMTFEHRLPHTGAVDVLVVVDNSMSMAEEQANLARSFRHLIRALLDPDEGSAVRDMHIGVVSTDMGTGGYSISTCEDPIDGDDGILRHVPTPTIPGCDSAYPTYLGADLERPDSEIIDKLINDFGCIAILGINGCGFEQQLKAPHHALVKHSHGANAGFLRDDSILVVLLVTDEEDCSVAAGNEWFFDPLDSSLGGCCRRCFHHPHLLEPVDTYIDMFRSLRPDPDGLLVGFIVGVPLDRACEGPGFEIAGCLEHEDMQERLDPVSMTRLVPTCVTSSGEAYAGRRFVQIAQALGDSAFVGSICRDDFSPAIKDMAAMVHEKIGRSVPLTPLPMEKVDGDPSLCRASCTLVAQLEGLRECPGGVPCHDPDGTGCAHIEDEDGNLHSLCEVPQVATRLDDPRLGCADPFAHLEPGSGSGWLYQPRTPSGPLVRFVGDAAVLSGSALHFSCCFK